MDERPIPVVTGSPDFRTAQLGVCSASSAKFPAQLRLPAHTHEGAIVGVTLSGRFDVTFARRHRTTRAGFVHVEPALERHGNVFCDGGARVVVLEVHQGRDPDLLEPCAELLDTLHCAPSASAAVAAARLARELADPDRYSLLAMEALALEILAGAARARAERYAERRAPPWLRRVREMLHAEFRSPPRIGDLARDAGVHPMRLVRAFRAAYGTTPGAYLRQVRCEWSLQRLALTDEPLAQTAVQAGYSDQSHFTREVRRRTGMTPAAYRAACRT